VANDLADFDVIRQSSNTWMLSNIQDEEFKFYRGESPSVIKFIRLFFGETMSIRQ